MAQSKTGKLKFIGKIRPNAPKRGVNVYKTIKGEAITFWTCVF
ncbi:MAG: hypothetical protein ABJM43_07145 [Paracoccaceae bacterium]